MSFLGVNGEDNRRGGKGSQTPADPRGVGGLILPDLVRDFYFCRVFGPFSDFSDYVLLFWLLVRDTPGDIS